MGLFDFGSIKKSSELLQLEKSTEELSYLDLILNIFSQKRVILQFVALGLFLGLLIAFTSPKEFTSYSYIILEENENGGQFGQMGALAGLAGISMPQMNSDQNQLNSELFPDVIQSRDFLMKIMKKPFFFQTKGKTMTLEEYFVEERPENIVSKTINFVFSIPSRVISIFSSSKDISADAMLEDQEQAELGYVAVSSQENYVLKQLRDLISIENEQKLIELKVSMPEPLISAEVNVMVFEYLVEYVVDYKTSKQQANLEFIEERVAETEKKFQEAQLRLASFRDSNQGIISKRAMTKEEQLQFEFNLAFNLYNSIKQELEQATIQLKRDTPIFKVMEKPGIPLGPSKPNRPLIIIFSAFLGAFIGVLYVLFSILKLQFLPRQ